MSNIQDTATLNEIRRLQQRTALLESQLARVVKNTTRLLNHDELNHLSYAKSGHTGFASAADLTTLQSTGPFLDGGGAADALESGFGVDGGTNGNVDGGSA